MRARSMGAAGIGRKTRPRFNQIFNLNDWLRPNDQNQTTRNYFPLFRHHVESSRPFLFPFDSLPDCSSKLDLNGGRLLALRFTCCSMDGFVFLFWYLREKKIVCVFLALATKMNFRVFLWWGFFCCFAGAGAAGGGGGGGGRSVCTACERLINMIIVWGRKKQQQQ